MKWVAKEEGGFFSKSEEKWDLEVFCEFGFELRIILSTIAKERKGVGFRIICPSKKGEDE